MEIVLLVLFCFELIALLVEVVISVKKKCFKSQGKVANEELKKLPVESKKTFSEEHEITEQNIKDDYEE